MRAALVLLAGLLFLGCPPDVDAPTIVIIDGFELTTRAGEGAATTDIREVWVFAGGEFLGTYPLPARIPLFRRGPTELRFEAGIRENGRSVTPNIYPFYTPVERTLDLQADAQVDLGTLHIGYRPETEFGFVEGFEDDRGRVFTQSLSASGVLPRVQREIVRSGAAAGAVIVNDTVPIAEVATAETYADLNRVPINVWLEVDYRGEAPTVFGVVGSRGGVPVRVFDPGFLPRGEWTKIYFNLSPVVGTADLEELRVAFSSLLPNDRSSATLYLDNLKLLYLPAP